MTTTRTINHDTVNAIANLTPDNLYDTLANLSLEDAYKMLDILVEEQRQRRDFHRQILINILVKETYKL